MNRFLGYLRRKIRKPDWKDLRSLQPISKVFGLDRGTPIDRYYIEGFLDQNRPWIHGRVLEIAESRYSRTYGHEVSHYEVLHTREGKGVTLVGDLTQSSGLCEGQMDCFICTQTFNFIYDTRAAILGAFRLLKPGGVLLATLAGISQISRYDMDRWGDYWRFTSLSAQKQFGEIFGEANIRVETRGNVLASIAFLEGIGTEELTREELDFRDPDYQLIITVFARKPSVIPHG